MINSTFKVGFLSFISLSICGSICPTMCFNLPRYGAIWTTPGGCLHCSFFQNYVCWESETQHIWWDIDLILPLWRSLWSLLQYEEEMNKKLKTGSFSSGLPYLMDSGYLAVLASPHTIIVSRRRRRVSRRILTGWQASRKRPPWRGRGRGTKITTPTLWGMRPHQVITDPLFILEKEKSLVIVCNVQHL